MPTISGKGSACWKTRSVNLPSRLRIEPATTGRFSSSEKCRKCSCPFGPCWSTGFWRLRGGVAIVVLLPEQLGIQRLEAQHRGHHDDERDDRAVRDVLPSAVDVFAHRPLVVEHQEQEHEQRGQQRDG